MENLKRKAEGLAASKVEKTKAQLKMALVKELPGEVSVEETSGGVVVSDRHLGSEIIDNSSLRDVAFLMRGVR
ncbi:MAG: hypothetical protein ABJP02_18200 [Parasphingorhabdus sp.]|uniref:hypothetical protein n=1 Tax=Parasphingorhabdus sp. TaxID=2709688 RepID=UPI00329940AD